jgi:hypothetical protein
MFGNRALYHGNWIATTVPPQPPWLMAQFKMPDVLTGYKWELYNIADNSASSPLCVRVSVDLVTMYWTREARNSLWDLCL